MSAGFVHLHVHSEYSLVDSTIRIDELVAACVAAGMPAVALTDQSNLFAAIKFYQAAESAGIKPIIGCDVWITDPSDPDKPTRLTLLCQNLDGYRNLSRLISRAWSDGRRGDHAAVHPDWLLDWNEGLIALAGRESEIGRCLLSGNDELAHASASALLRLFPDRLYLELVRSERSDEETFIAAAIALAGVQEIPVVASNDVRFLERDDFEAHEARVCIRQGRVLADPRRPHDYSPEQSLKSPQAMVDLFIDIPSAVENAIELARRCNLEFKFGIYHLPDFPVPPDQTLASWIAAEAQRGLEARLARWPAARGFSREDYDQRLQREVDVIVQMGFPGYFLIVADFINWAKRNDIPVGPGRGSGAGSLVAYALGITDIDPLRYGLLFERFLNPERVSMPDFDIDFCMDGRDRVIDYVADKYGRDQVSQIITYGTMAAKAVLRDSGRVLGMGYTQVDRIAKTIPLKPLDISLEDALGRSEKAQREPDRISADLREAYASDDDVRELVDLALKLEDLTRNAGKHAGGVVIAPSALTDFVPLYCEEGGAGVVTQFDKDDVETIGLVKFDFLGLRTLTIIDWAVKAINLRRAREGSDALDIAALPLDDAKTYKLFATATTVAVFQFESAGMQRLLKQSKPSRFEDLIALVSLYRPGPMDLIPDYVARKQGKQAIEYPDKRVEPILRETYGIMVYQEQVMQMAQIVGHYTLGSADLLRRAMGKKKADEMARHRDTFRAGAAQDDIDVHTADRIFDQMEKFAGYGFNKSHAAAYALIAYQTGWLKTHYPAEFMAAVLSSDMDNTDKIVNFLDESRALGLKVLPPDVNSSTWRFQALRDGSVRYGMGAIKGVGRGAIDELVAAREQVGVFQGISELCETVAAARVNKRFYEALINCGAMDALGRNRASLALQLPEAMRRAEQQTRDALSGQHDMFGASSAAAPPIILAETEEWPIDRLLAAERDSLGIYLSGHPMDRWRDLVSKLVTCPIGDIEKHYKGKRDDDKRGRYAGQSFTLAGQVLLVRRRGEKGATVLIEDASGRMEISFFNELYEEFGALLSRDAILLFEGGVGADTFTGGWMMRCNRVTTISDASAQQARVLRLTINGVDSDFSERLRATIEPFRGGATAIRIVLNNQVGQAEVELGPEWRVRAEPELRQAIEAMDGVLDAELHYR
ncbi:MAG: DNA polymerase III subunit alpha [Dokdonella sp.]